MVQTEVRSQNTTQPNVVVFAQPMSKETPSTKSAIRAQQKAFMVGKLVLVRLVLHVN